MFFIFFTWILANFFAECFMPKVCLENANFMPKANGKCCPEVNGQICSGLQRGECRPLEVNEQRGLLNPPRPDDRFRWPSRFFNYTCKCHGKFDGFDCSKCRIGHRGSNCSEKRVKTRKNIMKMTEPELRVFRNVLKLSLNQTTDYLLPVETNPDLSDPITPQVKWKETDFHYFIVGTHAYAGRRTLLTSNSECEEIFEPIHSHGTKCFLTWHRYYLLMWEESLADLAEKVYNVHDFGIPYWDWIGAEKCDPCNNEMVGEVDANGRINKDSIFSNIRELCGGIYGNATTDCMTCEMFPGDAVVTRKITENTFPTRKHFDFVISRKEFYLYEDEYEEECDSFGQALEGACSYPDQDQMFFMHNHVHNMMRETMKHTMTSPNDPMFLIHHSQIDRIFEFWLLKNDYNASLYEAGYSGPGCDSKDNIVGFLPMITHGDMFRPLLDYGIKYDNYQFGYNLWKNNFTM